MWKNEVIGDYFYVSQKEKDEEMKNMFRFVTNKCMVDSLTFTGFDDYYSDDLKYNYNFTIPDFLRKADSKIFVNMHLKKSFQNDLIETDKRKTDRENDYKYTIRQITELKVPQGYKASKIPAHCSFNNPLFGYTISYRHYPDHVIMEKTIYGDYLILLTSQFEEWNKMISSLNEAYSQIIVLEPLK